MKRGTKLAESPGVPDILTALDYLLGSPYAPNVVRLERVNDGSGDGVIVFVGDRFEERSLTAYGAILVAVKALRDDAQQRVSAGDAVLGESPDEVEP